MFFLRRGQDDDDADPLLPPPLPAKPPGALAAAIDRDLGGYDAFKKDFAAAGATQFGSGWAWLVLDGGKLKITKTPNAESPLVHGGVPLLTMDVWEHAYYGRGGEGGGNGWVKVKAAARSRARAPTPLLFPSRPPLLSQSTTRTGAPSSLACSSTPSSTGTRWRNGLRPRAASEARGREGGRKKEGVAVVAAAGPRPALRRPCERATLVGGRRGGSGSVATRLQPARAPPFTRPPRPCAPRSRPQTRPAPRAWARERRRWPWLRRGRRTRVVARRPQPPPRR